MTTKSTIERQVFAIVVGLIFGGTARAVVVFDNFPPYASGGNSINTLAGPIAAPFTFTTGTYSLTQITVSLQKYSWPLEFKAELYLGSGGTGDPLTKLGDFSASGLPNGPQTNVTLSPQSFDPVQGGQTYWIVFTETLAGSPRGLLLYSTANADSVSGLVSVAAIESYHTGVWNPTGRVSAMQIEATVIPEPAAFAWLPAGVVLLATGIVRRRCHWTRKRT
jgi:hypothetical protein